MSLLHLEGFDLLGNVANLQRKYPYGGSGTPSFSAGRVNGSSLSLPPNSRAVVRPFPENSSTVVGFAMKVQGSIQSLSNFATLKYDGDDHLRLSLDSSGQINVAASSSVGNTIQAVFLDQWVYIEIKSIIDQVNGSIQVRANNNQIFTMSPLNSYNASSPQPKINGVSFGNSSSSGTTILIDDVYVLETSVSPLNDYLGSIFVDSVLPDANGSDNDGTPVGEPTAWEAVSRNPADPSSDYIQVGGVNSYEKFSFTPISSIGAGALAVQFEVQGVRGSRGYPRIIPVVDSSEVTSSEMLLPPSSATESMIMSVDPNTNQKWLVSDINTREFGFKRII